MSLILFPGSDGVVPQSDAAKQRIQDAAALKAKLLDRAHTTEIYGPMMDAPDVDPEDLMPNPDDLSARWGFHDIDAICNDMAGNVLEYGGFVEGRLDVAMSLPLSWHVGVKGDEESEAARDEVEAAYDAIPERHTVERAMCRAAERGFMGAENIFDLVEIERDKWYVSIVAMIDRPQRYFGFDRLHRPYLKPYGMRRDAQRIDDYKVTFSRQGSLHTRMGSGFAQRCYPTVFAIDALAKQHMAAVERWSWVPVVVEHPKNWPNIRRHQELAVLRAQWKNVLLVPAEVDSPTYHTLTDGAYANSNATGASRMLLINKMVSALAAFVRGSQLSSGNQAEGSFARDAVADGAQMWKAPTDAAAREAMWNRGLVEPLMLANRPTLARSKWPRCTVDSSFGEDLRLFMELCESGVKQGVAISSVTWSERTGIPLAQEGDPILEAATSPAPILPDGLAADEERDPVTDVVRRMSETASIRVELADGRYTYVPPSGLILTDHGPVMAKHLEGGGHIKLVSAGGRKFTREAS